MTQEVLKVRNSTFVWRLPPSRANSPNCFRSDEILVRRFKPLKKVLCVMEEISTREVSESGSCLHCCDMRASCLLPHILYMVASFPLQDCQVFPGPTFKHRGEGWWDRTDCWQRPSQTISKLLTSGWSGQACSFTAKDATLYWSTLIKTRTA